jgi:proline racemase
VCRVAVDAHTGGEPFRVITAGFPPVPGASILAKRRYLKDHLDHLRTFLMLEPRGHSAMYGGLITEPTTPGADFGVLFMDNEGYSTMCGHGTIAVSKVAVELGLVEAPLNGEKAIAIDTPAGRIASRVTLQDGEVTGVIFANVPAFVLARDIPVTVEGVGEVRVDLAYGGAFYVYVEAKRLGVKVVPDQIDRLVALGEELKAKVGAQIRVAHPDNPDLGFIYGTIITAPCESRPEGIVSRNVNIFGAGQIDRSPTGSGTSGRLALMFAQGRIRPGQTLVNRSIIDTAFTGRITGLTKVGPYEAVATEVGGQAQIMGFHQFVLEPGDPLPRGFRITGG